MTSNHLLGPVHQEIELVLMTTDLLTNITWWDDSHKITQKAGGKKIPSESEFENQKDRIRNQSRGNIVWEGRKQAECNIVMTVKGLNPPKDHRGMMKQQCWNEGYN